MNRHELQIPLGQLDAKGVTTSARALTELPVVARDWLRQITRDVSTVRATVQIIGFAVVGFSIYKAAAS